MLRINEVSVALGASEQDIKTAAAAVLGVPSGEIREMEIVKESIDSRQKNHIKMIYSVQVTTELNEERVAAGFLPSKVCVTQPYVYTLPENRRTSRFRPIVVGFGPAGMFAAFLLAQAGLRPLVLERGGDVDARTYDVHRFWRQGQLQTESNVQFGEGGAGTFSDGKLTTGIKDSR